ncbi:uncharacterized protein LOC144802049 [Lissotriton helveticus]
MEHESSSEENSSSVDNGSLKQDLHRFINTSVEQAMEVSMKRLSKNMENSMVSMLSKVLAHSAGDSRKRKVDHSASVHKSKKSAMVSESPSLMDEDSVPHRPPTKEGFVGSEGKKKQKSKHTESPTKKLMISTILDTDDDMPDADDLFDIFDFNFEPVFDSEGLPMFDPSSIRHPNSTEWLPSHHVGEYISARLRLPLEATVRSRLKSECPKPALPDKITLVPTIDQPLLTFFSKFGKDPRRGVDKAWSTCQDKLLDIVGPLARIFDMAESARLDGSDLSAEDISMWVQRAFCLLGNANAAITHERRKGLLIKLDPKLANLAPMDPGSKANGLLFGENLVRDISRFVSTFASLDKAQQSIKKTFAPRVFGRAGRGRGRSSGRPYNQGSKTSYDNTQEYKPRFYPQRGRGFRGRGRQGYRNSNSNQPEDANPDILFLTETWLHEHSEPDLVQTLPQGYQIFRHDRKTGIGGGLAVIHKIGYKITSTPACVPDSECLPFTIKLSPTNRFSGMLIYRPPGTQGQFLSNLAPIVANLALSSANFTLLGDLNTHLDDPNDSNARELSSSLGALELQQLVLGPTHQKGHLLDPIFSNCPNLQVGNPSPLPWTDHFLIPLTWTLPNHPLPKPKTVQKSRNWSKLPQPQ